MCERIDLANGNFAIACGGRRMHQKKKSEVVFPAACKELDAAGYRLRYTRKCRRCKAVLEFWLTPAGKWTPLERLENEPEHRRVSHWSTCPFADEFRKTTDKQLDLFE